MSIIRSFREADRQKMHEITVTCFDGVSIDQNTERMHGLVAGYTTSCLCLDGVLVFGVL